MHIWISDIPNIDQHSNKFETWKWKTKPGSFLVTPKWSFYEVLENFMFQIQTLFFSFQETHFENGWYEPRYKKFHLNVCRPSLSTWIVSTWHYKTMCVGFTILCSFLIYYAYLISAKPNFDQHLHKFETGKWRTKPGSFLVTPK